MTLLWLRSFLLTQLVEVPIYATALRGSPWPSRLLIAFTASAITHPILWLVFPHVPLSYWTSVAVLEGAVVLVEGLWLWLWRVRLPRALLWSLAANVASTGAALLVRALGGPV